MTKAHLHMIKPDMIAFAILTYLEMIKPHIMAKTTLTDDKTKHDSCN